MIVSHKNIRENFFGGTLYIFLSLIAGIPIWLVTHAYANAVHAHLDEAAATGATICFITALFTGRFIVRTYTQKLTVMPVSINAVLIIMIIAAVSWLFYYPYVSGKDENPVRLLFYWLPFLSLSMCSGALIKIVSAVNRNKIRLAQTAAETSKSELQLLQSKLSPHFLFNTLNNIYGISITSQEKVPELLLKLADLLRYSVYGANEIFVPLKDEIAYIQNYIDFEMIRIGKKLELQLELVQTMDASIRIAPLLLIIFIENAFKHAKNSAEKKIFIQLSLSIHGNMIRLSVKNSKSSPGELKPGQATNSGFGITSARRRLELIYPGEYELNIKNEPLTYQVNLQLVIK